MNAKYSKENPLFCTLKQRSILSQSKDTRHLVLSFAPDSLNYEAGDSVAVLPKNPKELVDTTLKHFSLSPDALVTIKGKAESVSLKESLLMHLNLTPSRNLIKWCANLSTGNTYTKLLEDPKKLKFVLDNSLLYELPKLNCEINPQEFVALFRPLLPRFYSIASSQPVVGNEIHLTITSAKYQVGGRERVGICTNYLFEEAELNIPNIPIYLQKANHFYLPDDKNKNIIMVSAGTGIAPFRAFLQERFASNAPGKNWLFFGERNRKSDFYYREEWDLYLQKGFLDLDLAFSRDQEEKIYVQKKMEEKGKAIWNWIENGAYFYLCGDAKTLGKEVEKTLLSIFEIHGGFSEKEAREYLKSLKREKRYLKDVY